MKNLKDILPRATKRTTGQKIKEYRHAYQIDQKSLAEILKIGQSRLSEIENDRVEIGLSIAKRFCAIFPITLESLVCPMGIERDKEFKDTLKRLKKSSVFKMIKTA